MPPAVVALGLLGATSTSLLIGIQSRLQVKIPNVMSGRILALYSVAFAGSKPVGGFLAGWTTELTGPRFVFAACGVVIGGMFLLAFRQSRRPMRPVSNVGDRDGNFWLTSESARRLRPSPSDVSCFSLTSVPQPRHKTVNVSLFGLVRGVLSACFATSGSVFHC